MKRGRWRTVAKIIKRIRRRYRKLGIGNARYRRKSFGKPITKREKANHDLIHRGWSRSR
jgi:hypothetical protein